MSKVLEQLCNELLTDFTTSNSTNHEKREVLAKWRRIRGYFFSEATAANMAELEKLIALQRQIATLKGANKHYIESELLHIMGSLFVESSIPKQRKRSPLVLNQALVENSRKAADKKRYHLALTLKDFALEMYAFQKQRDTFSSQRKSLAFDIFAGLSMHYDVPDVVDFAIDALKKREKPHTICALLEFLKTYHVERNMDLSPELF